MLSSKQKCSCYSKNQHPSWTAISGVQSILLIIKQVWPRTELRSCDSENVKAYTLCLMHWSLFLHLQSSFPGQAKSPHEATMVCSQGTWEVFIKWPIKLEIFLQFYSIPWSEFLLTCHWDWDPEFNGLTLWKKQQTDISLMWKRLSNALVEFNDEEHLYISFLQNFSDY